jgi:uncharacterized membrane protein YgcG
VELARHGPEVVALGLRYHQLANGGFGGGGSFGGGGASGGW